MIHTTKSKEIIRCLNYENLRDSLKTNDSILRGENKIAQSVKIQFYFTSGNSIKMFQQIYVFCFCLSQLVYGVKRK